MMRLARYLAPRRGRAPSAFFRRADKIAGDLNVVLVVFAVGLATLDFTFLVTQKVIANLPPATQMMYQAEGPESPPAAQPTPR